MGCGTRVVRSKEWNCRSAGSGTYTRWEGERRFLLASHDRNCSAHPLGASSTGDFSRLRLISRRPSAELSFRARTSFAKCERHAVRELRNSGSRWSWKESEHALSYSGVAETQTVSQINLALRLSGFPLSPDSSLRRWISPCATIRPSVSLHQRPSCAQLHWSYPRMSDPEQLLFTSSQSFAPVTTCSRGRLTGEQQRSWSCDSPDLRLQRPQYVK